MWSINLSSNQNLVIIYEANLSYVVPGFPALNLLSLTGPFDLRLARTTAMPTMTMTTTRPPAPPPTIAPIGTVPISEVGK